MRNISPDMQTHLNSEVTTLCRCWVLTRKDAVVLGFTNHDADILVEGISCASISGMEASAIETSLGLNVDSQEISGALQSSAISTEDIEAGKYDGAVIKVFVVNWANIAEYFCEQSHVMGDITREDGHFRAELRAHSALMDQSKGRHFVRECQADLGDGKCGVDLSGALFSKVGSISAVNSSIVFLVSGLEGAESNWFQGGLLQWASGQNAGQEIEVAEHYVDQGNVFFHLWKPMPNTPQIGDVFQVTAGCDKRFATCKSKFQNDVNFRGFPHLPGNDFASSYASNSHNLDGGALVE